MGDLSRNVLLSGKFSVCESAFLSLWKDVHDMYNHFLHCLQYAVKGLKVVFSQTLVICSAKQ